MSRRDLRTQPGVLTPDADPKTHRPEGAVEPVPQIGKTLAKPRVDHNYLPPLQGGSFLRHVPGVKTPG
jgi:hypothetical protein